MRSTFAAHVVGVVAVPPTMDFQRRPRTCTTMPWNLGSSRRNTYRGSTQPQNLSCDAKGRFLIVHS